LLHETHGVCYLRLVSEGTEADPAGYWFERVSVNISQWAQGNTADRSAVLSADRSI